MKRTFYILIHLGYWLIYLFVVAAVMFAALQDEEWQPGDGSYYFFFVTGVAIIPPLISFYSYYHYLFPRFLQKRKFFPAVAVGLLLAAFAMTVGLVFASLGDSVVAECIRTGWPYAFVFPLGFSAIFGIAGLVLKGFMTWFEELKLKEELLEKTHRMELALVKSQLDPHFLFNTINNIDVLITKDPEEASLYLNKLSDIMRFMLYETKGEEIPLCKELEYIDKYIHLQKIRTANDQYVHYKVTGRPDGKKVAPMVFIPFIENAFKHSVNKKLDRAVDINIQIDEKAIVFACCNRFEAGRATSGNGFNGLGNDLIAKRLQLLYPDTHSLEVSKSEEEYHVKLSLLNGTH